LLLLFFAPAAVDGVADEIKDGSSVNQSTALEKLKSGLLNLLLYPLDNIIETSSYLQFR